MGWRGGGGWNQEKGQMSKDLGRQWLGAQSKDKDYGWCQKNGDPLTELGKDRTRASFRWEKMGKWRFRSHECWGKEGNDKNGWVGHRGWEPGERTRGLWQRGPAVYQSPSSLSENRLVAGEEVPSHEQCFPALLASRRERMTSYLQWRMSRSDACHFQTKVFF